jgi:hypothetical protein
MADRWQENYRQESCRKRLPGLVDLFARLAGFRVWFLSAVVGIVLPKLAAHASLLGFGVTD